MDPLQALWHVLNLFAPAALTGLLAATAAKLLWRRALAGVAWQRLVVAAVLACAAATLGGLIVFGRDGRLATYGAMALLCALTLWWQGFARRR